MDQSFTAMSDAAIDATTDAMKATGKHYPLELNATDFRRLMKALQFTFNNEQEPVVEDWAFGFVSGIAETLGIEMI